MGHHDVVLEASVEKSLKKKSRKKRRVPEPDAVVSEKIAGLKNGDAADGAEIDDKEPTMAEKLAGLDLEKSNNTEIQKSSQARPPSADSVLVLLKQALHADDRALLLDCLYNQDDKVISNSISLLNPVDIFKLLDSLISIIQSRGAVLVCALPWLRSLLLQHATRIMSQESSLVALNSLYHLIESRVATFSSALQLSTRFDVFFAGIADEGVNELDSVAPAIYVDKDESDEDEEEEEEDDEMETDKKENGETEEFSGLSNDIDAGDDMSD